MSKDSKLRIFISCLVTVVGIYLLLPSENSLIDLIGISFVVVAPILVICWLICKNTINWCEDGSRLMAVMWDENEDTLWVMRRVDDDEPYRLNVRYAWLDVYQAKNGAKNPYKFFYMDAIPFQRGASSLVMNEDGYMILKQEGVRLKIHYNHVVENYFAA